MLRIKNLSGKKNRCRVRNFNLDVKLHTVHALLCSSTTFLDDFLCILRKDEPVIEGDILLDEKDFFNDETYSQVEFLTGYDTLYKNLNVVDNIFFSKRDFLILMNKRKDEKVLDQLAAETGFYIKPGEKVSSLTSEMRKVVEILKCYYMRPQLLVVSEISNLLTYKSFSMFIDVLDKMKHNGTHILYLTSQWEEAVKVADVITVVAHGENCGTYSINDIRNDPSQIYDLVMGGKRFLKERKETDDLEMLRKLNESIRDLSSGYDLHKTLYSMAYHLVNELEAESCVVYLINSLQDSVVDIVAQAKNESSIKLFSLKPEIILRIIKDERIEYFYKKDANYAECFLEMPQEKMVIAYPIAMSSKVAGLIQLNFKNYYTLTEQNNLMLSWMAKEMAIVIENSRLMGRSVLLQESYHRIKNNLQIIVSLIELEKDVLSTRIKDQRSLKEISDMLDSVIGRVKSIAQMHNLLSKETIASRMIDMRTIVSEICNFYESEARLIFDFDKIYVPYSKAVSIALIINEMISNSIKHNPNISITITISAKEDKLAEKIYLRCSDNGSGFDFGQISEMQMGVGMKVLHSIVCYEFGGELNFYNQNGAFVEIIIPFKTFISA